MNLRAIQNIQWVTAGDERWHNKVQTTQKVFVLQLRSKDSDKKYRLPQHPVLAPPPAFHHLSQPLHTCKTIPGTQQQLFSTQSGVGNVHDYKTRFNLSLFSITCDGGGLLKLRAWHVNCEEGEPGQGEEAEDEAACWWWWERARSAWSHRDPVSARLGRLDGAQRCRGGSSRSKWKRKNIRTSYSGTEVWKLRGDVRPALKVPLSLKFVGTKACFGYAVDELNKCKLLILQDRRISENRSAVSMQLLTSTGFEIESKKVEISFVISTEGAFRTSDDHPIPSVPTCRSFCSEWNKHTSGDNELRWTEMTNRQKDRKTERQKDRKTER